MRWLCHLCCLMFVFGQGARKLHVDSLSQERLEQLSFQGIFFKFIILWSSLHPQAQTKRSVSTCYREEYRASKSVHQENEHSSLPGNQTHSTVDNDLSSTKPYTQKVS